MSEYTTVYQYFGSLFGMLLATLAYMLGGRNNKAIRRVGGAFVLAATVNVASLLRGCWSPWQLLVFPMLFGGFSLGYGADTLHMKFIRRLLYALAICTSGLVFCLTIGGNAWWLFIPHVGIGIWSIYMGIKSVLEAPAEEGFICVILNLALISYPFIGGLR